MITAIIAAAGSGTRFGSATPKQFLEILGKPVLIHCLESFDRCADIDEIVVVVASVHIDELEELVRDHNIAKPVKVTAGGETRAASVMNGIRAADERSEIIAVHDGARPVISAEEISATVQKARETGAACLVAAVTDTIKTVDGGLITGTVDRRKLYRALTPQTFRADILRRAFDEGGNGENITDECSLVEKLDIAISAVIGSSRNIKITHREDMIAAEAFLRERE